MAQIFFLFGTWIYSSLMHFMWLSQRSSPPLGNGITYILKGMYFCEKFPTIPFVKMLGLIISNEGNRDLVCAPYSPFVDLVYWVYYRFCGIASEHELIVNMLFVGIAMWSIYTYSRLFFPKVTGFLAAIIFTALPGVLLYSKTGFLEFHIMCLVLIPLYFLEKSDGFSVREQALMCGITSGMLFMIKWESALFLGMPFLVACIRAVRERKDIRWIGNFFLMFVCAAIVGGWWYFVNAREFFAILQQRMPGQRVGDLAFGLHDVSYYITCLAPRLVTPMERRLLLVVFIVLIIRTIVFWKDKTKTQGMWLLSLYVVFPFLVFSAICVKDDTHILPCLPFFAIMFSEAVRWIYVKKIRYIVTGLFILHAFAAPFVLFIPYPEENTTKDAVYRQRILSHFFLRNYNDALYLLPKKEDWSTVLEGIITFIHDDFVQSGLREKIHTDRPTLLVIANNEPVRYWQLQYYNMKMGSPLVLNHSLYGAVRLTPIAAVLNGNNAKFPYILMETPIEFKHSPPNEDRLFHAVENLIEQNRAMFDRRYEMLFKRKLLRGTELSLYRMRILLDNNNQHKKKNDKLAEQQ